jgi:hypothetical protein
MNDSMIRYALENRYATPQMPQTIPSTTLSHLGACPLIVSYQTHQVLADSDAKTWIPAHRSPEKATYMDAHLQTQASTSVGNGARQAAMCTPLKAMLTIQRLVPIHNPLVVRSSPS